MRIARIALMGALLGALVHTAPARAEADAPNWSFDGPFGTYDRASLQRGYQVYSEVCANCHSLRYLSYRNLEDIGLSETQVKAIAAAATVPGDMDENGTVHDRGGLPSDHFQPPFPNDNAARFANNGALPPDQSSLVNAREDGSDYIYGVLTGYVTPPAGYKVPDGMYYNAAFSGHNIAMPQPLQDDQVTYTDGTKASLQQESHDVVTFLTWASNPELEQRKRMGVHVVFFLILLTGVVYALKRKIWAAVH